MIFITQSQKEFLRTYPYPFTILGKPRKIPDFCDPAMYVLFGVRVAEICLPEDIRQTLTFPIFLTSANKSGEKELLTAHEVRTVFGDAVEILGHESAGRSPSNIFQFVGDTTEIAFTRQNYPHI